MACFSGLEFDFLVIMWYLSPNSEQCFDFKAADLEEYGWNGYMYLRISWMIHIEALLLDEMRK